MSGVSKGVTLVSYQSERFSLLNLPGAASPGVPAMKFLTNLRSRWVCSLAALLLLGLTLSRSQPEPKPAEQVAPGNKAPIGKEYESLVRPFLDQNCASCHGGAKPKGRFRVAELGPDFVGKANRQKWQTVLRRIRTGEMPPKEKPRPPEDQVQGVTGWIAGQVQAAEVAMKKAQGRTVLRRLNRVEYENTLRDLLGVSVEVRDILPPDSSAHGFDNVGEALHVSSFLMEKYLEAAEKALSIAIANGPQPPLIKKRYSLKDQHQVKTTTENVFRKIGDTVVLFSSSPWQAVILYQFYPPDRGNYRFRISAYGYQSSGKPVTYQVMAGTMGMAGKDHLVGYFDAPGNKAAVVELVDSLEPRSTIRIHPYGLAHATVVHKIGADKYEGPGLAVEWVDVEGPLHDTWPPESHRRIFGDLPQAPVRDRNNPQRVEVVSKNPEADAKRILLKFAGRAFRRTVTEDEIKPFLNLVRSKLAQKYSFEKAVRVGLLAVMVSPNFLFLRENPGELDDFALASRLSYFLWSTMPDAELLALAEKGKLSQAKVLKDQVERMLQHHRAAAFTENFVSQWLGLRDIDATMPSHILYPEYDEMLKYSMLKETHLFFDEVLKNNLSLTNFVASDFTMLNGRLAKHYGISGIPGVDGWKFSKVKLPPDSHRGGVLTMASVLKVTANGTYTSPVLRGAWVLDRILGTPPPPPPEGVSAIEPDIRGATTIREQLAKHRKLPTCASCHVKIDPPGFALESYDVIGGWRDFYRSTGNGKPVMVDGKRMAYLEGRKVDPADVLPSGKKFKNIDELKQLLLQNKDQIARALTERLVIYATGAAPKASDEAEIKALVAAVRARHYGLRTLVHEIVQSKLFRQK
jgi:mono/diheme cytochrome c family protein